MTLPPLVLSQLIDGLVDQRAPRSLRSVLVGALPYPSLTPLDTRKNNETLRLGVVGLFIHLGGWNPTRGPGHATRERLWEAYPNLDLTFSTSTEQLVLDLITQPLLSPDAVLTAPTPPNVADELLLVLIARLLDAQPSARLSPLNPALHRLRCAPSPFQSTSKPAPPIGRAGSRTRASSFLKPSNHSSPNASCLLKSQRSTRRQTSK